MTRLLLIFVPGGITLARLTEASAAAPIIVLGGFCAAFALAWLGVKFFERPCA